MRLLGDAQRRAPAINTRLPQQICNRITLRHNWPLPYRGQPRPRRLRININNGKAIMSFWKSPLDNVVLSSTRFVEAAWYTCMRVYIYLGVNEVLFQVLLPPLSLSLVPFSTRKLFIVTEKLSNKIIMKIVFQFCFLRYELKFKV